MGKPKGQHETGHFGANIALLKKIHGHTYRAIEAKTGINRSSIHEYIHGQTRVPLENAKVLAKFFNTTVDRLINVDLKEESR